MPQPNFIDKLAAALTSAGREALDALTRTARARSVALYAVGGSVRDLLLERPTLDLDLTLEGDAPALARTVATGLTDVRCTIHPTFRTATLKGAGIRIDVASARAETYQRPGAPSTKRASATTLPASFAAPATRPAWASASSRRRSAGSGAMSAIWRRSADRASATSS